MTVRTREVLTKEIHVPPEWVMSESSIARLIQELSDTLDLLRKLPQHGYRLRIGLARGFAYCGKDHFTLVLRAERDADVEV